MARTRSEQYPEIRRNILKRSAVVFASEGYASSSISDLANAIDLSRGALYHYFPSKDAILTGILDDHLLAFIEMVDAALDPKLSAVEQLRAVTQGIVAFNARSREEQVLILNEVNQLPLDDRERMQGLQRQILDRISDLLIRIDAAGKITPGTKRVYTMMYLGIVNYTFTWFDPKGRVSPEEFADLAVDLFLNGMLGGSPVRGART